MQFITRAYNDIEVKNINTVTKTSSDIKLKKEFLYYNNVPTQLKIFNPRIIKFSEINNNFELEMEYYAYKNLSSFFINQHIDFELWDNISKFIFTSLKEFEKVKYGSFSEHDIKKFMYSMYVEKTQKEYLNLRNNFEFFNNLSKNSKVIINEEEYSNFEIIWDKIEKHINKYITEGKEPLSFIHGDFCFSNILCGVSDSKQVSLKYIDPRGTFGIDGCHGDRYYDLAKLKHSVDGGYEYIIYDLFKIESHQNKINFSFNDDNKKTILNLLNKNIFDKFDQNKIDLIQGLIYIGMCARHYDSLDRQKIMFSTGIRLLNNFLRDIQ